MIYITHATKKSNPKTPPITAPVFGPVFGRPVCIGLGLADELGVLTDGGVTGEPDTNFVVVKVSWGSEPEYGEEIPSEWGEDDEDGGGEGEGEVEGEIEEVEGMGVPEYEIDPVVVELISTVDGGTREDWGWGFDKLVLGPEDVVGVGEVRELGVGFVTDGPECGVGGFTLVWISIAPKKDGLCALKRTSRVLIW
jgi:hypothetical protein